MSEYKAHLFICTNAPDKEGKCGHKKSENLRKNLKARAQQDLGKEVRVNMSGCLGFCEKGIAAVIYPQQKWFFNLSDNKQDEEKLFEELKKALAENNK